MQNRIHNQAKAGRQSPCDREKSSDEDLGFRFLFTGHWTLNTGLSPLTPPRRSGKVLVLMAVLLPMLCGVAGLVVDSSLLMTQQQELQQIADAAATSAARELALGHNAATAIAAAESLVHQHNGLSDATVQVSIPPVDGPYAGLANYAQVKLSRNVDTYFIHVSLGSSSQVVTASAVAGAEDATVGGAIAVLDPNPPPLNVSVSPLPLLTLPQIQFGGLELLGLGQLRVNGAVFVNTEWGGLDENGDPVGQATQYYHAVSCMPILPLTKLRAEDLRVTGGVDNPSNYGHVSAGQSNPMQANRLSVPDPLANLPVPTLAADPANVNATLRGSRNVIGIPLIGPTTTLSPGVYEWIQVTSGKVVFEPGVYIIRNKNPLTQISLAILAGEVQTQGAMFYITDSTSYTPASGLPDANDGENSPPPLSVPTVIPSVVINFAVLGNQLRPLNDPGSPFHGILIYQRRTSRLPIVMVDEQLLGPADFSGTIYSKWGQLIFVGHGTYDARFAVGNVRIVNALQCTIAPTDLFPPARDVFLVQ